MWPDNSFTRSALTSTNTGPSLSVDLGTAEGGLLASRLNYQLFTIPAGEGIYWRGIPGSQSEAEAVDGYRRLVRSIVPHVVMIDGGSGLECSILVRQRKINAKITPVRAKHRPLTPKAPELHTAQISHLVVGMFGPDGTETADEAYIPRITTQEIIPL